MKENAYLFLVMHRDLSVHGASIFNAPIARVSKANPEFIFATILSAEADDYEKAREMLLFILSRKMRNDHEWVLPIFADDIGITDPPKPKYRHCSRMRAVIAGQEAARVREENAESD